MEKNQQIYVLYDRDKKNPGYFIVTEEEGIITQFLRLGVLYQECKAMTPIFCLRGYHQEACSTIWNEPPKTIAVTIEKEHPLYESFKNLANVLEEKPFSTIDTLDTRKDTFSASLNQETATLMLTKDPYGMKKSTHFIDILIGSIYSCRFYREISELYQVLATASIGETSKEKMEKVLMKK